jgi:hypothetical protein
MLYYAIFRLLSTHVSFKKGCVEKKQANMLPSTTKSVVESKMAHKSASMAR